MLETYVTNVSNHVGNMFKNIQAMCKKKMLAVCVSSVLNHASNMLRHVRNVLINARNMLETR